MTKRITTLLLAAAMLLGTATVGSAIEFKTKGIWSMNYEYGSGGNFTERGRSVDGTKGTHTTGWGRYGEDQFEAKSRVRLQLGAVASEALSGTVYFEIGGITWGRANRGGALGADGTMVKIKHSYLDWVVPQTEVKVRMGIERIFLPDFTTEASQAFDADVAGMTVSVPVSDWLNLSAFWARPYNDNWTGTSSSPQNYLDNFDIFGLAAPVRQPGFNITPWAMLGAFEGADAAGKGGAIRRITAALRMIDSLAVSVSSRSCIHIDYCHAAGRLFSRSYQSNHIISIPSCGCCSIKVWMGWRSLREIAP